MHNGLSLPRVCVTQVRRSSFESLRISGTEARTLRCSKLPVPCTL
jgi:hypothetical protein